MAALIKKRALAEYCGSSIQEESVRPLKRLQIVKRSKTTDHLDFDLSHFENNSNPTLTLHSLLNLHQLLPLPPEARIKTLRKLLVFLQDIIADKTTLEKLNKPSSIHHVIISKLFSILPKLASATDAQNVLDKLISITQSSSSNVIISHGIHASFIIIHSYNIDSKQLNQVLQMSLHHLQSTSNYIVKVRCLEALGGSHLSGRETHVVEAITNHSSDQDNRVRTAAFNALYQLQKNSFVLPSELYHTVCNALDDDYRCVRESALYLIEALALKNPNRMIGVQGSDHHIRLVDHAFSQICNSVNDVSVRVRTLATSLLGSLPMVSDLFLHQTLDKKLMSNMCQRKSAHEKAKVMASNGGEWATGKKWAEDVPKEKIDANSVQIISNGACGAFVHGLEDEFLEVRTTALTSICKLARKNSFFANQCLDFLVDMFNDEIEDVRLKAIQVLQDIAHHIKLRPDQLDEILHALKDSWLDIRESLHTLLATCKLSTTSCVTAAVDALLDNLRRYPQDKRSIHRCLKHVGINHPELVLALVPQLLLIHPYFDGVEPSVQDGEYICKLILVLNAAAHCSTILPLLEEHTLRHYAYLRDSMPLLVPLLKFDEKESETNKEVVKTNTATFLSESLEKVSRLELSSTQFRLTIYSTVHSDLEKLADIDPNIAPASTMSALYIQSMYLFTKILSTRNWLTPSLLSLQQSGALKSNVDQLLRNTLKLKYAFSNLTSAEKIAIRSLRVRVLALQLVYVVHGSTGSALGLCDNFLEHTESFHKYLSENNIQPDAFLNAITQELSQLEEPRPGAVARILQPHLLTHQIIPLFPFSTPSHVKMAWAEILEPASDSECVYKLGSGLVVGVQLDAELWHIPDLNCLRIRVTYPDHLSHLMIPNSNDIRVGEAGCLRLLTTVLISAQVWSEACQVGISLVLDLSEQETLGGRRHSYARSDEGATTVQLCQPVKVLVWPKQIRKGI